MLKRAKSFLIAVLILFTAIIGIRPIDSRDKSSELFTVELQPIRINASATHIIRIQFKHYIAATEWLTIQWPEGTKMPELSKDPVKRQAELEKIIESIFIGAFPCGSCHSTPRLDEKERSLTFYFPRNINPDDEDYTHTTIVIPDRAGFSNPSLPGAYTLRLITASHGTMTSSPYLVVESRIGVPKGQPEVLALPHLPLSPASYDITFNVGEGGALIANQSLIRVRFPEDFSFNQEKDEKYGYWIKINQVPLRASYTWNKGLLLLLTPIAIPNSGRVHLEISQDTGIINPPKKGEYYLEISTSEDREWVKSLPFYMVDTDIPLFISPNKTNRVAHFEILFSTGEQWMMDTSHPLQIKFPNDFTLPETLETNAITINGQYLSAVSKSNHILLMTPKNSISTEDPVRILIKETANIINPPSVGLTHLQLLPSGHSHWYQTRSVLIEEASLTVRRVHPHVWNACEVSSYRVSIETGQEGLIAEKDWIELIFPPSFRILPEIAPDSVLVNTREVSRVELGQANDLKIFPGFSIDHHEILIDILNAVTNACEGDQSYHLLARTSREIESITSPSFFIAPPLPKVFAEWVGGKWSQYNWYSKPPLMRVWSDSEDAEIMFSWLEDSKEQFERYRGDQEMPDGFYRMDMYYYAQDPYGESAIHKIELQVNTYLPSFEILHPLYPVNYTHLDQVDISGRVRREVMDDRGEQVDIIYDLLFINEEKVEVDPQSGLFLYQTRLHKGEQDLLIRLGTQADLFTQRTLIFHLDQEPPILSEISPLPSSTSLHHALTFSARTKPFSEVWINEEYVSVDHTGNIMLQLRSKDAGKEFFAFLIKDRFGNESTYTLDYWFGLIIEMRIGRQTLFSNSVAIENDVPPLIHQQSTYLPVRALAMLVEADLHIITDPRTGSVQRVDWITPFHRIEMTVGKKEAVLNGQRIAMTAPPVIIQQRLMMPVRWMIEQMGGTVTWEASTQNILITYIEPKPR